MAEERSAGKTRREFIEFAERAPEEGSGYLADVHPADAVDWLADLASERREAVFARLAPELQAALLEHAEEPLHQELVSSLAPRALTEVVSELPADAAADVLAQVDEGVAADVLRSMPADAARELRRLAAHEADTAGGVMTTDIVTVPVQARVGDAIKALKKEGEDAEPNLGVYVVDERGVPVGYLPERALITHSIHEPVRDAMVAPFLVGADEDQEEAARVLSKYGLQALAVVDERGVLAGVISAEDAQEVLAEEVIEDVHRLVGAFGTQQTRLPIRRRVLQRVPLMAVTVVGGLASARILALFSHRAPHEVDHMEAILRYLPLIIGLAGNVGVQSSTILVRAFATGEVEPERDLAVLGSEVAVGFLIALLCGLATLFVAAGMEWRAGPAWGLGFSVSVAMLTAVTWAALLGCLVPMGCRRLSIDPAIVAGPFLITLSDVSGVGIYLLVARSLVGPA